MRDHFNLFVSSLESGRASCKCASVNVNDPVCWCLVLVVVRAIAHQLPYALGLLNLFILPRVRKIIFYTTTAAARGATCSFLIKILTSHLCLPAFLACAWAQYWRLVRIFCVAFFIDTPLPHSVSLCNMIG